MIIPEFKTREKVADIVTQAVLSNIFKITCYVNGDTLVNAAELRRTIRKALDI